MAPSRYQNECFSEHINWIRSILVKTLSSENISKSDVSKIKRFSKRISEVKVNKNTVDKDARLRNVKEKQNEERQKKLEEIKAQALAAQKFKEQKEQERRRRLEEMRVKDDIRRQQVEERKRAINEAERDRLESILRRNQEREARIEAKKRNERSNIVFAFGSSTPRMLDPTDASVSFWGHRRATSTQNITMVSNSLTRRQSERDLDVGSKKRATSAGGLERSTETGIVSPTTPAGCASGYVGRRRTDLVPTIPSRDSSFTSPSSRKSLNHSPGRAYSMSRLDQLAKPRKRPETGSGGLPALNESCFSSNRSVTRSMSHLVHVGKQPNARGPLNKADSRSMHQLIMDGAPVPPLRVNRATHLRQQKLLMTQQSSSCSEASSRPSSSLSQQSTSSVTNSVNVRHRMSATPRRPRPASIAVTGVTTDSKVSAEKIDNKPPLPKTKKSITKPVPERKPTVEKSKAKPLGEEKVLKDIKTEEEKLEKPRDINSKNVEEVEELTPNEIVEKPQFEEGNKLQKPSEEGQIIQVPEKIEQPEIKESSKEPDQLVTLNILEEAALDTKINPLEVPIQTSVINSQNTETKESDLTNEMTASMSKPRITTEEEAKAALAERRRLAREEAERQAELERQRIEAEQKAELERQRKEEEQVQLLIEMQRKAEEERLQEAIKETRKREEEEKSRREEEQRLRQLKEEADKKAREEAERQKAELQEKFKNEEREREERRRRVEMIMSRTRGKNSNLPSQQNSQEKSEKPENKINENKLNEENKLNGTKQENGTQESKEEKVGIVDNIIPNESVKNANTVTDTISTDSLNSNSAWQQSPQQYDSLM